jgi:hypothetical protein
MMTARGFTKEELVQIAARTEKLGKLTMLERKLYSVVSLDDAETGLSGR